MSSISIIGTGNMARTIGTLAVAGGNSVEIIGRDQSKAADLVKALGGSTTAGEFGAVPAGDIVIVSLLYASVVRSSPSTETPSRARSSSTSATPSIPRPTGWQSPTAPRSRRKWPRRPPASASVVKAFNTVFGVVLAQGRPLDVFIAGDDERAKAGVAEFIESLRLRPLDVGGLNMAHWLEGTGPGRDGPRQAWGGQLRLRPRHHRSRLSRTAPGPSRERTGARCAQIIVDVSLKIGERSFA